MKEAIIYYVAGFIFMMIIIIGLFFIDVVIFEK